MTAPRIAAKPTPGTELQEADFAGPALRAFFQIADHWGLSTAQQRVLLGNPPASTYFKWKKARDGALPRDALERISYLLGIYKALQILLPDPQRADHWVSERQHGAAVRRPDCAAAHAGRQCQRPVRRAPVPRRAARLTRQPDMHGRQAHG